MHNAYILECYKVYKQMFPQLKSFIYNTFIPNLFKVFFLFSLIIRQIFINSQIIYLAVYIQQNGS